MDKMEFYQQKLIFAFIISISFLPYILTSEGDRSPFYRNCVKICMKTNCTSDGIFFKPEVAKYFDSLTAFMQWKCLDECRYNCMWHTVKAFQDRGLDIPKFHGKWPFERYVGIQEPASVFASLLNLLVHVHMHVELTRHFPLDHQPMVIFWHLFAGVCINGWAWSILFHVKDTPFTEFMDYSCALSMVMILYIAAVVRVFNKLRKLTLAIILATIIYYVEHVIYLFSGKVDYAYNMIINCIFGAMGTLIWTFWAVYQYLCGRRYVYRVGLFCVLTAAALSLELFDFPPIFHWWDAHAFWHLSTAFLPILFYRFVIDDLYAQLGKGAFKIN